MARPGEFSERAFLNGKIDIAQAEAVADLIDAGTAAAARAGGALACRANSRRASHELQAQLTELRVHVEAAIDFPDEEVDFLSDAALVQRRLDPGVRQLRCRSSAAARQGACCARA